MKRGFLPLLNKNGQTPEEIFTKKHEDLVKEGGDWLTSTSNVGMVVAGILVTVTLTMSTTVLDRAKEGNKQEKPSKLFTGSSFVSFCTSLLAVVMFLSIATSTYRRRDFRFSLLGKLLVGLTALYTPVVSTLISFATGFFFIFRDQLLSAASSYLLACLLLIIFFSLTQFSLYFHLVWATFKKVPKRIIEWLYLTGFLQKIN